MHKQAVSFGGFIDDYAFLLRAYLELYGSTFDPGYLQRARNLCRQMIDLFWDKKQGKFFFTAHDAEQLIVREKETYDGAIPSGNSVALEQLIRLFRLTGEPEFQEKAEQMLRTFKVQVEGFESGHTAFLQGVMLMEMPSKEIVLVGKKGDREREKMIQALSRSLLPNVTLLAAEDPSQLSEVAPFVKDYRQIDNRTTVYVCENFACRTPTTDVDAVINSLQGYSV